jgi:hypothetical protein
LALALFPILFQLVAPLGLIVWLALAHQTSVVHFGLHSLGIGLFCCFLYLAGRWDVLVYSARYGVLACFVVGFVVACLRLQSPPLILLARTDDVLRLLLYASVAVFFAFLVLQCLRGLIHRDAAIDLAFPLHNVDWYIVQGGSSAYLNAHHDTPAQALALDIVALDAYGRRANALLPNRLQDYVVFNQPVYAPCTGEVVAIGDGLPDLTPPARDQKNAAGNYVAIACKGATVLLAHLRRGSVLQSVGASVTVGDRIGNVGNSGNTTEPHLHIHAVRDTVTDETRLMRDSDAVAMRFGGRILSRNSRGRH